MPTAVKLSDDLVEAARTESEISSRSMTQQVEHWARIGRALERSGAIDPGRIREALRAQLAFDELGTEERSVALAELDRAVLQPEGDAGLATLLAAEGGPLSTVDGRGRVVKRQVGADSAAKAKPAPKPEPAQKKVRRAAQRRKKKSAQRPKKGKQQAGG